VPIARRRTAEPGELRTPPHALDQEAVSDVYLRLWPRRMRSTLTTTMRQAARYFPSKLGTVVGEQASSRRP
jgi:hypothetical protein